MSIAQKFEIGRLLTAFGVDSRLSEPPCANACSCVSEHSTKLWQLLPGRSMVINGKGKILWRSTSPTAVTNIPDIFEDHDVQTVSLETCLTMQDTVPTIEIDKKRESSWIEGQRLGVAFEKFDRLHFAPLPGCGGEQCEKTFLLTDYSSGFEMPADDQGRQDGEIHQAASAHGNEVPNIQASKKEVEQPTLFDVEKVLKRTVLEFRKTSSSSPMVTFTIGADIPAITSIEKHWEELLHTVLGNKSRDDAVLQQPFAAKLNVAVSRRARVIHIEFAGEIGPLSADESRHVELLASKLGKVRRFETTDANFILELIVPINAGIIAPELKNSEERVRRLHVPANKNKEFNPIPRNQRTG